MNLTTRFLYEIDACFQRSVNKVAIFINTRSLPLFHKRILISVELLLSILAILQRQHGYFIFAEHLFVVVKASALYY
jgi:hypothetical protein